MNTVFSFRESKLTIVKMSKFINNVKQMSASQKLTIGEFRDNDTRGSEVSYNKRERKHADCHAAELVAGSATLGV